MFLFTRTLLATCFEGYWQRRSPQLVKLHCHGTAIIFSFLSPMRHQPLRPPFNLPDAVWPLFSSPDFIASVPRLFPFPLISIMSEFCATEEHGEHLTSDRQQLLLLTCSDKLCP